MTWLVWNVRGVNKRYKQKEVNKVLQNKKVKLASLIETRVKQPHMQRVLNNIVFGWGNLHNYHYGSNRRIWVVWDTNSYDVQQMSVSPQLIDSLPG